MNNIQKYLTKKRCVFLQDVDFGDIWHFDCNENALSIGKLNCKISKHFKYSDCEFYLEGYNFSIKTKRNEYNFVLLGYMERSCYVGKFDLKTQSFVSSTPTVRN